MSDDTLAEEGTPPTDAFGSDIPRIDAEAPRAEPTDARPTGIEAVMNVNLDVQVVLGECRMPISTLLKLGRGSVIELDQRIGEPVSLVINDRLVARGDLVKLAEDRIGVSLTEIVVEHPASIL